jgi:hypothetical protein
MGPALGDALGALAASPEGEDASGVVVVTDGIVNAGEDPVAAGALARCPGPRRAGGRGWSAGSRHHRRRVVGRSARRARHAGARADRDPPRSAVSRSRCACFEDGRELGHVTAIAPGNGAEAGAEFRVTPARPGLAVWTARVDFVAG